MGSTAKSGWAFYRVRIAQSILAALCLAGLTACGGSSGQTTAAAGSAVAPASTAGDLIISAALLDASGGNLTIDGRNFTGGYTPIVTLDGAALAVTAYTPTQIQALYTGPADPSGALLLTVQRGPAIGDRDSDVIAIGDVDPADPVTHDQLVIWSILVEDQGGILFLVIMGNNFDNGVLPTVRLGETVLGVAGFGGSEIRAILPDAAILAEGAFLTGQTGPAPENYDAYDLRIGEDSSQIPPEGDCYPCWTEGPEDTNLWHGGATWYEPLYYQLEHDYVVDMASYFTDSDRLPLGHKWRTEDLHDYIVNDFPATDITWFGWDYIAIEPGGILKIRKGYRWDGPTTSPIPYSSKSIHASMVHDALYDLIRMGHIDGGNNPITVEGFRHRLIADCLLYMISKDDGRAPALALSDFKIVRAGGWTRTGQDMPGWKEHAVAEAGPDQENACGVPGGETLVELDGGSSRHTLAWTWEENGSELANGMNQWVFLAPGLHRITLDADDPYAPERGLHHYADTDDVMISVTVDSVPPEIHVPDGAVVVPNDPGECSAVVTPDVSATDDCGEPQVTCEPLLDSPFPVGSTSTTCTAVDTAGNTAADAFYVKVEDVEPPVITLFPAPSALWPPNHEYVTLTGMDLAASVEDNCSGLSPADLVFVDARSSEADNGTGFGDGNTTDDILIAPDGGSVRLRAERNGTGGGRVYTVTVKAVDEWGNAAMEQVEVVVPHSK